MKPAPFTMLRPSSLDEALAALSEHQGNAKVIAGGQSLVPLMNLRMATPDVVIDLGRLTELRGIESDGEAIVIGAMMRQSELLTNATIKAAAPLLNRAAQHIGHLQTRARGTVGGSLAHADPAAELPAVMVALGATMVARSVRGLRTIPASKFFASALTTALADDEILCEVRVPTAHDARVAFREVSRRLGDFAIVSAAVQISTVGGERSIVAALGGICETPYQFKGFHGGLDGGIDVDAVIHDELKTIEMMSDVFASSEYRQSIAAALLGDCLREVLVS